MAAMRQSRPWQTLLGGAQLPSIGKPFARVNKAARCCSNVSRGTAFELATKEALERLDFELRRVGGADDRGIDLQGYWRPKQKSSFPVIVQCKNETRPMGPKVVRELSGVLASQAAMTLGGLASSKGFSNKALDALYSIDYPIAAFTIEQSHCVNVVFNYRWQQLYPGLTVVRDTDVIQFLWK